MLASDVGVTEGAIGGRSVRRWTLRRPAAAGRAGRGSRPTANAATGRWRRPSAQLPATVMRAILRVGAATLWRMTRSLPTTSMSRSICSRLPAMVISLTG